MLSRVQLFLTPWPVPARLLCPWDSPGQNTGVGCHFLLLGIFPTQGLNPGLLHCRQILYCLSHLGIQVAKNLPAKVGDLGSVSRSGRSPGEGNDNPLQYSCLQNPMDRGAWQATVQVVAQSQTRLSNFHLCTVVSPTSVHISRTSSCHHHPSHQGCLESVSHSIMSDSL